MKLIEENKLSLKTPVADFFTEYKTREKSKITIWHLLTHTSGMSSTEDFYFWNQVCPLGLKIFILESRKIPENTFASSFRK